MITKILRSKCKKTVQDVNITIQMSEQAFWDLAMQKHTLVKLAAKETKESEHIDGIINLIDAIQDQAVEQGWNEKVVFPIEG